MRKRGRNSDVAAGRAGFASCSCPPFFFPPLFQRVCAENRLITWQPMVIYFGVIWRSLLIDSVLIQESDGLAWLPLGVYVCRCITICPARQSHWSGLKEGTGLDPPADDRRPLVWPERLRHWPPRPPLSGPSTSHSSSCSCTFWQVAHVVVEIFVTSASQKCRRSVKVNPNQKKAVCRVFLLLSTRIALMPQPVNDTAEHRYH